MTDKFVVLPMNIFITGASSGIGEYVAYEYSKRGATIAPVSYTHLRAHET